MPYSIELREDLASIVAMISEDFDIYGELPTFCQKIYEILDQSAQPLHYVCETNGNGMTNFEELVAAINMLVRGDYPFANHKNFIELVLVTNDQLSEMAVRGMQSDTFGNVKVAVFSDMQSAFEHVQMQYA